MSQLNLLTAPSCYLEIGQSCLRAMHAEGGLELPLERLPSGKLTANCRQHITLSLQGFFKQKTWQPRTRVFCAISARGVSLRRLTLPPTNRENLHRVLLLQLESEFPVSPDELAWGYRQLTEGRSTKNGSPAQLPFLVAAVRKEVIEEYSEILSACGVTPLFTLGALARDAVCPPMPASRLLLDIGRDNSELIVFENGVPTTVRILSWGGESITQAIQQKMGVSHDEAEKLKIQLGQTAGPAEQAALNAQGALDGALDSLARLLNGHKASGKVYLTGRSARMNSLVSGLSQRLGSGVACESLEPEPAAGRSAAILGLKKAVEAGTGTQPLLLQTKQTNGSTAISRGAPWKWVGIASGLALVLLLLPYLQGLLLKPYLARKLAAIKADRGRLALIDGEFAFLQYLKQNQPPYLDAIYLLARSAPPGARLESISMNRRGDLSLRLSMQNSQQVTDFRSKLIDSGFFANVTLEEQAPVQNQPKLNIRMSAQWKSLSERQALAMAPTAEEIEKAKTRPRTPQPGMPPMMMPPPMMGGPPGVSPSPRRGAAGPAGPVTLHSGPSAPGASPPASLPPGALPPGALPPGVVIPQNP